jgi:primosomal protein N' (replication factor Y) (superfamily II helicase)
MDRDTTSKRGSHETLIRAWEKGEIDILVGTQMITKGHDVRGVTLVGALLADLSLNLPDFRAAERTFQLLTQVAGRSGRGSEPGRVVIQTYAADHYTIKHLTLYDYKGFFDEELEFRRALNYPPFCRLINLRIDGPKSEQVEKAAKTLAHSLGMTQRAMENFRHVEILGPAPAPIEKLRNRYRWQILLKGRQTAALLELARHARAQSSRARATRIQADRTRAQVGDHQRGAQHRDVLHEHDLMDLRHHGIVHRPEPVHHEGDRQQEQNQQPTSEPRAIAEANRPGAIGRRDVTETQHNLSILDCTVGSDDL